MEGGDAGDTFFFPSLLLMIGFPAFLRPPPVFGPATEQLCSLSLFLECSMKPGPRSIQQQRKWLIPLLFFFFLSSYPIDALPKKKKKEGGAVRSHFESMAQRALHLHRLAKGSRSNLYWHPAKKKNRLFSSLFISFPSTSISFSLLCNTAHIQNGYSNINRSLATTRQEE